MKKVCFILSAVILFSIMTGCQEQNLDSNNIIGCWTNPAYADNSEGVTIVFYKKSKTLSDKSEGIKFFEGGTLIERKNIGWCGTPPIQYDNFSGKWYWQDRKKTCIEIDVAYWGGMEHKVWKIIKVTKSTLEIEILSWKSEPEIEN